MSRFHRTRYAMIAAWCGQWPIAYTQFEEVGNGFSRQVVYVEDFMSMHLQATLKGAPRPEAGEDAADVGNDGVWPTRPPPAVTAGGSESIPVRRAADSILNQARDRISAQ
jgi:hypothetical protein